jgi:glycosyltransferase involved in cell wall biosynthesis
MRVALDLKNLALYSGGIAHWLGEVLPAWIISSPHDEFIGITPQGAETKPVTYPGFSTLYLPWISWIPRQLRHVVYDNWLFPRCIQSIEPNLLFSPYHDLRLPKKGQNIYSVITVHDLCFLEVPNAYPWAIRAYYRWMMRLNVARAHHILTVSEATRQKLIDHFSYPAQEISVVPNALSEDFLNYQPSLDEIEAWRSSTQLMDIRALLYTGGIEYRKNIPRLLAAMRLLWAKGEKATLCITGNLNDQWKHLFSEEELRSRRILFLGRLSLTELRLAYQSADAVVYPSLCEGFGRACLEARVSGTPLACSDLAVFHEVVGTYASYFDPLDVQSMAVSIDHALRSGRQAPYFDERYQLHNVQEQFVFIMKRLSEKAKGFDSKLQKL